MGDVIQLVTGKDWLESHQVAGLMGCSVNYVYRLRTGGFLLPAARVGRTPLYRRRDVERYIETHPKLGQQVAI